MKQTILALGAALLAALPATRAAAGQTADSAGVAAFFEEMAIAATPGQQARFVVGDGVDGYLDARTQANDGGEGYVTRAGTLFKGYASAVDGKTLARAGAREAVLPYGHRVRHADGSVEEMALISGERAIVMRVSAATPARLAIQPMLAAGAAITRGPGLIGASAGAAHLAIAASVPFEADQQLTLRTAAPARSFTVVAALGATPEEAAERARRLAGRDAIGDEQRKLHRALTTSVLVTSDPAYNKALNWAKASARSFVVEEFGTGIWAGLPWFRDNWGRDTFIALPGTLLVSGQFGQAKAVLENFARYQNLKAGDQEYGRVPNRVSATERATAIIYNTVDGTPWMLREAMEYIQYTGDRAFARQMYRLALPYFEGAIAHYVDARGLLAHDAADTWMDARIENKQPWSARGPYAVEIQALWHTALRSGAYLAAQAGDQAHARQWSALADKAQRSFMQAFWDGRVMADRLRDDGSRDVKVRPNQLMLVSIPFGDFVPPAVQAAVTRNAVSELLYPYGIASLSQNDPTFHPRHENEAFHHKDAAYHNGTVWGWNAGFTVTALNKFGYQDLAWDLTRNLGRQILGQDLVGTATLGAMSELLDALPHEGGKLKASGTYAQSWSVAEYARNAYQDFLGFRPRLLDNTLAFTPAIPAAWTSFHAELPFGAGERLDADFVRQGGSQQWTFRLAEGLAEKRARSVEFSFLTPDRGRARVRFLLTPGTKHVLRLGGRAARLDGRTLHATPVLASQAAAIGTLRFQTPKTYRPQDFPMLREKDALKGIVDRNEYR
jgi:glycogen debranching enzyme